MRNIHLAGPAVASGFEPLSLATDGAGSARILASCCGLFGLKPTLGRIPDGLAPDLFGNFTHMGAMTRTIGDLVQMLNAMSGPHSGDPWSVGRGWLAVTVPNTQDVDLKPERAPYVDRIGNPHLARQTAEFCDRALNTPGSLGPWR